MIDDIDSKNVMRDTFGLQFTPGPWRLLPPSGGVDANWHVADDGDTFVARVFGFSHAVDGQSAKNAALIAKAPEMFELMAALAVGWAITPNDPGVAEKMRELAIAALEMGHGLRGGPYSGDSHDSTAILARALRDDFMRTRRDGAVETRSARRLDMKRALLRTIRALDR